MKDTILKALRQSPEVSGERLGQSAGISRTAVWKYIKALRAEGYQIDSAPGKGYSLKSAPDTLSPNEVRESLKTRLFGHQISYHHETVSTQDIAQSLARNNAGAGTIVVAERQTGGKGRIGRDWTSLPGSIAFSIILRPEIHPTQASKFTIIAGVAAAQAISQISDVNSTLKWPNDIFLGKKKVGGILTEMSAETDRVNYVIIGIGLNVNTSPEEFPPEISQIATSIRAESGEEIRRAKLLGTVLQNLETLCEEFSSEGFESIRQRWIHLSNTIGQRVRVTGGIGPDIEGTATDMDPDGMLIVEEDNGTKHKIIAGDVSLRDI